MARLRVYELAKKLNMSPKELLQELEELGVSVKNHMSYIDEEMANIVIDLLEEDRRKRKEKQVKPAKKEEKEEKIIEEIEGEKRAEEKRKKIALKPDELKLDVLASKLGLPQTKIIQDLFVKRGLALRPGQILKLEEVREILKEYNVELALEEEKKVEEEVDEYELLEKRFQELYQKEKDKLAPRPPVVTIMGHVDHGKTTLLDRIRSSRVAEQEEGGITQSIGAYQVEVNGKKITFIDTPGHELFTEMRARGVQATDIVVLVVAADDGVMPQTIEAYNHAKAANVPVIVAINKIDKPNANVEKTKKELVEKLGLIPEDWGGDTVVVPISARTGQGVDELLEMILLVADMHEIKCYPTGPARAVIIESKLDNKMGPVASVIVKDGILKVGDAIVTSNTYGKVRNLYDDRMRPIRQAEPSQPVLILGFEDVPDVHSNVYVVESLEKAKAMVEKRLEKLEKQRQGRKHLNLEELLKMMQEREKKVLNLILKADTYGSVAALQNAIAKLQTKEIELNVVHAGVGEISTSDVMLAAAVDGVVLGFRVKVNSKARLLAEQEGVDVRTYTIIYKLVDDLKLALEGMLEPEEVEEVIGHGEIKKVFKIAKVGKVAGVQMTSGKADRNGFVRIYRNGQLVFEGRIESLKHYKEDVSVVEAPQECGIKFAGFEDIQEGDELEFYVVKQVKRKPTFLEEQKSGGSLHQ